jgi:hypothetical protein
MCVGLEDCGIAAGTSQDSFAGLIISRSDSLPLCVSLLSFCFFFFFLPDPSVDTAAS